MGDSYDYLFKILIIGNQESNKHKVLDKFLDDTTAGRSPRSNHTVSTNTAAGSSQGLDYKLKDVYHKGKKIKLQLWDTAGQERFRSVTSSFYRGSHGGILVFTLSKQPSFAGLKFWLEEIRANAPHRFVILLVGTTSVHEDKEVQQEVVEEFAYEHNVQYFECVLDSSGPSGTAEIFSALVDKIMENFLATGKQIGDSIVIDESQPSHSTRSKHCCSTH